MPCMKMRMVLICSWMALHFLVSVAFARDAPRFLVIPENRFCHELLKRNPPHLEIERPDELWGFSIHHENSIVSLWNLLVSLERSLAIPQWPTPRSADQEFRILNLASSLGAENYALSSFFGSGQFLEPGGNVSVASMDINAASITAAIDSQKTLSRNVGRCTLS